MLILLNGISCSSYKMSLHKSGQENEIIENAILDFLNTNSSKRESNGFDIEIQDLNNEISTVVIGSITKNKLELTKSDTIGNKSKRFPSKYYEMENKLFVIIDSTYGLTKEMINKLSEYRILDSTGINTGVRPLFTINESKKATHYFFCKNDITQYKSIKGTAPIGEDTRSQEFKCSK